MDRGAWWATAHGVEERDTTEHTHTLRHQFQGPGSGHTELYMA